MNSHFCRQWRTPAFLTWIQITHLNTKDSHENNACIKQPQHLLFPLLIAVSERQYNWITANAKREPHCCSFTLKAFNRLSVGWLLLLKQSQEMCISCVCICPCDDCKPDYYIFFWVREEESQTSQLLSKTTSFTVTRYLERYFQRSWHEIRSRLWSVLINLLFKVSLLGCTVNRYTGCHFVVPVSDRVAAQWLFDWDFSFQSLVNTLRVGVCRLCVGGFVPLHF